MHRVLMMLTHGRVFLNSSRSQQLRMLTRSCAEQMSVSRASVWRLNDTNNAIVCELLYQADEESFYQEIVLREEDYPNYFAAMKQDRLICVDDAEHDPRTSDFHEDYLKPVDIRAMLDAPIFFDGHLYGVLCLEHTGDTRAWDLAELSFATAVADTISLMNEHTAWLESEQRIERLAYYDQLTGLGNRQLLEMRVQKLLSLDGHKPQSLTLISVGLDRFKAFNDAYGYTVGNELLQVMAQRLRRFTRGDDALACRLGGDEFSLFLNHIEETGGLEALLDRLHQSLVLPVSFDRQSFVPSVSIGVARYPEDASNGEELIRFSESAVNLAKSSGRGGKAYYHQEWSEEVKVRMQLEREVRQAFVNHELEVFYQPIVDSTSLATVGFEALIRWLHPRDGLKAPGYFLDAVQQAGMMAALGDFVLDTTCRDIARLGRLAHPLKYVSVNLSAEQLKDEHIVERIADLLKTHQLPPNVLELEVVEEVIGLQPDQVLERLTRLSALGISLAIDDFGTGHSSLSRLKSMPVNKIKIDKSFVDGLPDDPGDQSISRSIIGLARGLGLKLVAEGVETRQQAEWLVERGCDYLQGYYFSRPHPLSKLEQDQPSEHPSPDLSLR